jgi:hypothetical protein
MRYTTVFTNEDGGTQSAALMARWGRMTDIEWIYEIRVNSAGEIISEIYQGADHQTKNFTGPRLASHPLILDATVNNNFADTGCSALRVSPILVKAELSNGSRETMMDANPWTYRMMAEEAIREGRVDPTNLGANTIADPRDYFYVEIESAPENAAVSVEIGQGDEKSLSDWGDAHLRVDRPGFVRIAVRKPIGLKNDLPEAISLVCSAVKPETNGVCRNFRPVKIVWLDPSFAPLEKPLKAAPKDIETGQKYEFKVR